MWPNAAPPPIFRQTNARAQLHKPRILAHSRCRRCPHPLRTDAPTRVLHRILLLLDDGALRQEVAVGDTECSIDIA